MPDRSRSIISTITLCLLIVCSAVTSQDTPEVPDASSISNAKPTLGELMARFAEIESSYLPFHIDYSESLTHKFGPFLAGVTEDESNHEYRAERGHRDLKVWMRETTIINAGVSRTERSVTNETGYHLKETSPLPGKFFDDDGVSESAEPHVRPLEGVFPLMFHTDAPILLSQHYAAEPKEFAFIWHDKLARVWCRHRSDNGLHVQVELWLDPDFAWHPVFMRRYLTQGDPLSVGERYPDEWKVTEFRKLNELVRVSAGEFSGPIRRNAKTDESREAFVRSRFRILKSTYQTRVPDLVFSPETPIGGSPIAELEPVGGEQVEVKSSDIAALSSPALTPEQRIALATVTNQKSATGMRPAAAVNTTSTLPVEEIQAKVVILEAERAKLGAKFPDDHFVIRRLDDQLTAFRNLLAGDTKDVISVLNLRHAEAGKTSRRLQVLFPEIATLIVADEQTNSLLLRCNAEPLRMIKDIVSSVDEGAATSAALQEIKSYALKHISAAEAQRIIVELFGDDGTTISANQQGNVLLARGVPTRLAEVEAILLRLEDQSIDVATHENPIPKATISGTFPSLAEPKPISKEPAVSIAEHRRRMIDLEKPVVQLAEKVRAAETSLGKDHPDAVRQRAELRILVQNTFAERQEIQRAELAEFTRRLERMRRSIETRERIAERIVDRRVEELLSAPAEQTPNSTNSFRRGNTSTNERKDLSFIPWKVPKNSPRLEISPTAWGESVHGLRAAMAVTDGPGELAGLQQLHLVVQNLSNVPIQISDTGWSRGFQMAVHVTRSSGEQVETLRPEKKIMFAPSSSSHLLESGETVVLATALIGRGIDSNPNDSVDLLISDHRPQTTENRESYRVGTSVIVPRDAGLNKKFRLHTGKVSLEFPTIPVDKHDVAIDQRASVPPKSEPRQTTDRGFSVVEANDQTSPPQSDAEKAIARLVLVFFQDEARRAVPGLMIDHGAETLILTTGPATIVPDGVAHAKDRTYLEFPETVDVEAEFIDTKTTDIFFHRAKAGLTTFKLERTADLEINDRLSAIILSGQPTLRVTPNAARISALDQGTTFSLSTHKFRHEFTGLIQIDQRLPEGTPLFKDGELAGITLLGTRFMKDDVPGSYVVPASRIFEVLRQVEAK